MKNYLYIIVFLFAITLQAQEEKLFDQATQFYADENYEAAIENYQEIIQQGKTSTAVYFNLGNAYFKLDQIGPSIYYYHKALQLSPNDEDILTNLAFAEEKTIDAIEESPATGWEGFVENLISTFNFNTWAVWAIVFAFLFMLFGIAYYFSQKAILKRLLFSLSGLSFVFVVLSVIFAYQQLGIQQSKKFAIIFAQETKVHAEPNHNSPESFRLHEGTKVKILDNFNGYTQIQLQDNTKGWLKEEVLKAL